MHSRYTGQKTRVFETPEGETVLYQAPRILPQPDTLNISGTILVKQGTRLDLAAYKAYRNPLLYYKICDANQAMNPWGLLEPGRRLLIPT